MNMEGQNWMLPEPTLFGAEVRVASLYYARPPRPLRPSRRKEQRMHTGMAIEVEMKQLPSVSDGTGARKRTSRQGSAR